MTQPEDPQTPKPQAPGRRYSNYVLGVLLPRDDLRHVRFRLDGVRRLRPRLLGADVLGVIFFWLAGRSVARDESTRIKRAQAAGEVVEAA